MKGAPLPYRGILLRVVKKHLENLRKKKRVRRVYQDFADFAADVEARRYLHSTCKAILKHATSQKLSMFGRDVAPRMTNNFSLGRASNDQQVIKELEEELLKILDKAKHYLDEHRLFKDEHNRAKSDKVGYLAYANVDGSDYPWHDEDAWKRFVPEIQIEDAAEDWMQAVFLALDKDYDKAKEIAQRDH